MMNSCHIFRYHPCDKYCWELIRATTDDEDNISWEIGEELILMITEAVQAPGLLIVHQEGTYENTEGGAGV